MINVLRFSPTKFENFAPSFKGLPQDLQVMLLIPSADGEVDQPCSATVTKFCTGCKRNRHTRHRVLLSVSVDIGRWFGCDKGIIPYRT